MKYLVTWDYDKGYFCGERTISEVEFFDTQEEAEDCAARLKKESIDSPYSNMNAYNIEIFECKKI
jgi:hypothetical protein